MRGTDCPVQAMAGVWRFGFDGTGLTAVPDPITFEGLVFTALADEREDGHENLKGQEDQEDVHACVRALRLPSSSGR